MSLLHALGSPRVKGEVTAAREAAVGAAVGYLERHAAFTRTGRDGIHRVASSGFVAAAFRHRTSRAGYPQLHTHVLIANLARIVGGGLWMAAGCSSHKMDTGAVYQAQLRAGLTRRLGAEWNQPVNGLAEMTGVPRTVLRAFSRRRAEIIAALEARVRHPYELLKSRRSPRERRNNTTPTRPRFWTSGPTAPPPSALAATNATR